MPRGMQKIATKQLNLQSLSSAISYAHHGKTKRSAPQNVKSIRAQLISCCSSRPVQSVFGRSIRMGSLEEKLSFKILFVFPICAVQWAGYSVQSRRVTMYTVMLWRNTDCHPCINYSLGIWFTAATKLHALVRGPRRFNQICLTVCWLVCGRPWTKLLLYRKEDDTGLALSSPFVLRHSKSPYGMYQSSWSSDSVPLQ